jgi:hypothetical protein
MVTKFVRQSNFRPTLRIARRQRKQADLIHFWKAKRIDKIPPVLIFMQKLDQLKDFK